MRLELRNGGYTRNRAWLVDGTDFGRMLTLPALVAVIEHPRLGRILFDCGYGKALAESQKPSTRLYGALLPFVQNFARFLPDQADLLILSHFHPDHIGGLREAPLDAPVLCSRDGLAQLRSRSPLAQAKSAFFDELLPENFDSRLQALEDLPRVDLPPFGDAFDIAGDGGLLAVPLPGHAVGQYGLLCRVAPDRRVFLVADAAWVKSNIADLALPKGPARLLMEDWPAYVDTLRRLQAFGKANPDVVMIPSHCEASIAAYGG